MILVFRWDWKPIKYNDDMCREPAWSQDWNYRDGELIIFWMMQRKGFHRATTVEVCKNDEPKIIEWLQPRLNYLIKLWSPLEINE